MRVTNNITTRQFLTNNNRALTQMLKSENRIATQRRFNRVSEDPINGSKAMTIRRQLRDLDIYNKSLSSTKALFSAAEINLYSIADEEYIRVEERLTQAVNGTYSDEELTIIATELDEIADQMVKDLNADFSERQIFGGASNGKTPFRIERVKIEDTDGNVVFPPDYYSYYNNDGTLKDGVDLDDIPKTVTYNGIPLDFDVTNKMILPDGSEFTPQKDDAAADGAVSYKVFVLDEKIKKWDADNVQDIKTADVNKAIEQDDNSVLYPGSKPIYVDVGIGIQYNENYEVDPQTAIDVSLNGAEITGNGIDIEKAKVVYKYKSESANLNDGFPADTIKITVNGTELTLDVSGEFTKSDDIKENNSNITKILNSALSKAINDAADLPDDFPKDLSIEYNGSSISVTSGSKITVGSGDLKLEEKDGSMEVSDRYSKNLMQLVLDAAFALKKGDQATVNAIIDRANEANNHILSEITTLGTKQQSIEFYENKNKDYEYTLKERQNVVEGTDMENEIINYEAIKAAYDATLKMGAQILPHSIFDFV